LHDNEIADCDPGGYGRESFGLYTGKSATDLKAKVTSTDGQAPLESEKHFVDECDDVAASHHRI
jgi:hypothetical protein